jgi:hypothetical protein
MDGWMDGVATDATVAVSYVMQESLLAPPISGCRAHGLLATVADQNNKALKCGASKFLCISSILLHHVHSSHAHVPPTRAAASACDEAQVHAHPHPPDSWIWQLACHAR